MIKAYTVNYYSQPTRSTRNPPPHPTRTKPGSRTPLHGGDSQSNSEMTDVPQEREYGTRPFHTEDDHI